MHGVITQKTVNVTVSAMRNS